MNATPFHHRNQRTLTLTAAVALAGAGVFVLAPHSFAEDTRPVPPPTADEASQASGTETAVLAGGCFWGVQGVFQHVKGVESAVSGYTGGNASTAHYDDVSTGETGHAESVKITFDPHQISYGKILQIYFSAAHDPTERDHQGPDYGTQYRSTIFPTNGEQARVAAAYKAQLDASHVFDSRLATTIEPGKTFYPAEAHHQNFLARNPTYPYIAVNDIPKVEALKRMYPNAYRADPVLVAATASTD